MSDNTSGLAYSGAFWFLTSLFITEAVYCVVFHFVRSKRIRDTVIVILALVGHCEYYYLPFKLPFAAGAGLSGLGMYHLGFILRRKISGLNLTWPQTLVLGAAASVSIFLNGYVNMRVGTYGFLPLFYMNALASCITGISLAKLVCGMWPSKFLSHIGMNSIIYLCLNEFTIYEIFRVFKFFPGGRHTLVAHVCVLILTVAALLVADMLFSKKELNSFIGRGNPLKPVLISVCVLLAVIAGVNFARERRQEMTVAVNLPDCAKISGLPTNSEALRKIIALNMKYLLNTQWKTPNKYAFATSTHTGMQGNFRNSPEQERKIQRSAKSFRNWRDNEYLDIVNTVGGTRTENAIRDWGHTCFALASALKTGIYDAEIAGITSEDAARMTVKLAATLARNHCANSFNGWGNQWQSALWAENVMFSCWLMWDYMTVADREFALNMLVYEADRFIGTEAPYYMDKNGRVISPNDTKAEENAWNSRILAIAVCMLPEHKNNKLWEGKLIEYLLSSCAVPEDTDSEKIIDGFKLKDILKGSNLYSDGTMMNHGLHHIDYMTTTIEGMTDTTIIYALAGREIPASSIFNHDTIYTALVSLDLGVYDKSKAGQHFYGRSSDGKAGNTLNMPGINDWGGKWYTSCCLADTEAEIFGLDKNCPEGLKASEWLTVHLEEVLRMISRNDRGEIFAEGENYFVSGETYAIQNLCKSYLLKALQSSGSLILKR